MRVRPATSTDGSPETSLAAGILDEPGWGRFVLAWDPQGLVLLGLPGKAPGEFLGSLRAYGLEVRTRDAAVPEAFAAPLRAYLGGDRRALDAVPLHPPGTRFQQQVWAELRKIPFGETRTYGDIARSLRNPDGARAVGAACGANHVPLVIPCHRVVGAHGDLGGFTGGLPMKLRLLEHEQSHTAPRLLA